jgi:hypothetical protein
VNANSVSAVQEAALAPLFAPRRIAARKVNLHAIR